MKLRVGTTRSIAVGARPYPHLRNPDDNLLDMRLGFLSDTVALAVVPKPGREHQDKLNEFCVVLAARFAGAVMQPCSKTPVSVTW